MVELLGDVGIFHIWLTIQKKYFSVECIWLTIQKKYSKVRLLIKFCLKTYIIKVKLELFL